MKVSMKLEGGDTLAKVLAEMSERASRQVLRAALTTAAATPMQARAKALAPREPGAPDLADHIVVSAGRNASLAVGPSKEARTDQPKMTYGQQGFYVEYGTSDTPAKPFLRPAFDETAPKAIGAFASEVWSALISKGLTSSRGGGFSGGGLL